MVRLIIKGGTQFRTKENVPMEHPTRLLSLLHLPASCFCWSSFPPHWHQFIFHATCIWLHCILLWRNFVQRSFLHRMKYSGAFSPWAVYVVDKIHWFIQVEPSLIRVGTFFDVLLSSACNFFFFFENSCKHVNQGLA